MRPNHDFRPPALVRSTRRPNTVQHTRTRQHAASTCDQGDQGQAIGLILIAVVLIGSIAIAVGLVGSRFHDRSAAQTAADAAALAGVLDGAAGAREAASRNGASIVRYVESTSGADIVVVVEVELDGETATARASTEP